MQITQFFWLNRKKTYNKQLTNVSKTKITVFSRGKKKEKYLDSLLEKMNLKWLVNINSCASHLTLMENLRRQKKPLVFKGNRAVFVLLRKCRHFELPVDIQLELSDILVKTYLFFYTAMKFGQKKVPILLKKYICDSVNMSCK